MSKEDKGLYKKQMESQGCIGYTTSKFATKCTIHPSKRSRMNTEVTYGSCSTPDNPETSSNESTAENNDSSSSEYTTEDQTSKRKYHSAKSASGLFLKFTLSTRQASRVCQSLADGGVDLPTPSQTATWRRVIKNGKIKAEKIKHLLQNENFCLHFDGKRIGKKEASPTRSLNLSAVCCDSGSSECIFTKIKKIIDEFDAWSSNQMIICDATSVNTGRKNGIVIRLQKEFENNMCWILFFVTCLTSIFLLHQKIKQKLTIALSMTFQVTMKSCKMNISLMVLPKLPKVKLKTIPGEMTTSFCLNYVKPSNISKHRGISKNQVEKVSTTPQCQVEFQSNVCTLSLFLDSKSSRELGKSLQF